MKLSILGTRGIPARHGGFETFAEQLAIYLTEAGHEVTVYCQDEENRTPHTDVWQGIRRVHLYGSEGPLGTMAFDWKCVWHSLREKSVLLTLGYNTAVFSLLYRFGPYRTLMNMDGIEWKRQKSSPAPGFRSTSSLIIPRSPVIWSGRRVRIRSPSFRTAPKRSTRRKRITWNRLG